MREIISTRKSGSPAGAYSQAVKVGNLVWTAGMVATDPATGKLIDSDDIGEQTIQTLKNLDETLAVAGTSLEHAVRVGAFIHDIAAWGDFNEAYKQYFKEFNGGPPARTTIGCGLAARVLVEIDVVAVVPD